MKAERQSNIELLRIISMLLILSFHIVYIIFQKEQIVMYDFNYFIMKIIYFFGELGVNLFILITGYFLVKGKVSSKKIIKMILEVNFYYLILKLIYRGIENNGSPFTGLTLGEFSSWLFPTIFIKYWFITAYILVYILMPYFNILINNLKKEEYKKMIIFFIVLWSIIPTIFGITKNSSELILFFNRFIWFIIMYFIGAYIRLYSIKCFDVRSHAIITAVITFVIMIISMFIIFRYRFWFAQIGLKEISYFWTPNSFLMLILSISIFKIFTDINIKYNKWINIIGSTTLGVYLIHGGPLQSYIWNNIFRINKHIHDKYLILYIVIATVIVFIVSSIIDLIRQFIEKHTVDKVLDSKFYDNIQKNIKEKFDKIQKYI